MRTFSSHPVTVGTCVRWRYCSLAGSYQG